MNSNPILIFRVCNGENCEQHDIYDNNLSDIELVDLNQKIHTMITKTREAADSAEYSEG